MEQKTNDKQLVQLGPNDLAVFEYVSTRHDARIGQGVKPEDLLVPGFWAHHAVKLKPFDEIRARAEDGTWLATYVVLDCSRTWAKVMQLSLHRLTTADVALTQASESEVQAFIKAHNVVHRGPHKWSVVRASDRAVLQQGMEQKDQAIGWLDTHARSQVGGVPAGARAPEAVAT